MLFCETPAIAQFLNCDHAPKAWCEAAVKCALIGLSH